MDRSSRDTRMAGVGLIARATFGREVLGRPQFAQPQQHVVRLFVGSAFGEV